MRRTILIARAERITRCGYQPLFHHQHRIMSSSFLKEAVTIPATAKHTATVIFLHGLGDTGHGWAQGMKSIASEHIKYDNYCYSKGMTLASVKLLHRVREYITKHNRLQNTVLSATRRVAVSYHIRAIMPVTLNHGYQMPSWFDLYALNSKDTRQDEEGIKAATKGVHAIIDDEVERGISSERIIIGGFSQGGALAMYSAYTYPKPLAGIIGLSCWLCLHHLLPQENSTIPVLQGHGDCDNTVAYEWGKMTSDYIKTFNSNTHTFKTYSGLAHSSSAEEMNDIKKFIEQYLPADVSKM